MNYIKIYIKRTFFKNFKKQLFLILGIAAFMASLSLHIMIRDSNQNHWKKHIEDSQWGFLYKISNTSNAMAEYLRKNENVERVDVIQKLEMVGGISQAEWLVSSNVPETWKMKLLYGEAPKEGEILLTENAMISNHQPVPGETVRIEVKAGEKKKQIEVKVSGVVEAFYTEEYAFLNEKDFEMLVKDIPSENRKQDLYFQPLNANRDIGTAVLLDIRGKYGSHMVEGCGDAGKEPEYVWREVLGGVLLSMIVGGACLSGIIYMVLLDEKKNVGILRALGAKKSQIAGLLSARILITGGIGILLGSTLTFALRAVERSILHGRYASGEYAGLVSVILIPVIGILILLLAQTPGIFVLLRDTPVNQINEVIRSGDDLISFRNRKIFRVKHPIWWYAGLEGKRLRGRSVILILITVMGMVLPMWAILGLEEQFQYNEEEAVRQTYSIEKISGFFTPDEVTRILELQGIKSAGFPAEQNGMKIAEYGAEPLDVRVHIMDESIFEQMKLHAEQKGITVPAEARVELVRDTGVVIRPTLVTKRRDIKQGEVITLISQGGERFDRKIAFVAQGEGEVDAEYYVFIGYESYCRIFGVPELQSISVTLQGITMEKVAKWLQENMTGVSIIRNEILLGNTIEELNYEELVSTSIMVGIMLLASVMFLLCYNSFFYLSKIEQYRKLYVIGASKKMIKHSILFQALRMSLLLTGLNIGLAYLLYRIGISISSLSVQNKVSMLPLTELFVIILLVVGISMGAAWFASKQVLRELEQKA